MTDTLPIMVCRHYDVEWTSSHSCNCRDCGKQGYWTSQGISIWVRTGPKLAADRTRLRPLAKVG